MVLSSITGTERILFFLKISKHSAIVVSFVIEINSGPGFSNKSATFVFLQKLKQVSVSILQEKSIDCPIARARREVENSTEAADFAESRMAVDIVYMIELIFCGLLLSYGYRWTAAAFSLLFVLLQVKKYIFAFCLHLKKLILFRAKSAKQQVLLGPIKLNPLEEADPLAG